MTIQFSAEADEDLAALYDWLEQRSPIAAEQHRVAIMSALAALDANELGSEATLSDERRVRRWPVRTLVIYDIRDGETVLVLRIYDARRVPIERR
jgi:plasmid stabilization system protein ParE